MKLFAASTRPARTAFASLASLASFAMLLSAPSAHAISEQNYLENFKSTVLPFCAANGVTSEFTGQKGAKIRYIKYEIQNEKGAIVISQGFTESYYFHAELQYDLVQAGYSVYELDHRGQGLSDRVHANPEPGYVDDFDYFTDDFKTFVDTVVRAKPHKKLYLFGNSMGGPIAANYLGQNRGVFAAAALAVPMMEVDVGDMSETKALQEINAKIAQSKGAEYSWDETAPGTPKGCTEPEKATDGYKKRICAMDDIELGYPGTAQGGASWQWMKESVLGSRKARTVSARKIDAPVLQIVASKDNTVKRGGQKTFCANAPRCEELIIQGSSHGIVVESDEYRQAMLDATLAYFAAH